MSGFDVKVENVVVFATLGNNIPLEKISHELEAAEYSPESFPGVIYRIKDPMVAALIFSSGKIVCTGARSIDTAKTAVQKVIVDLRNLGIDIPEKYDLRVENIVASTQIEAKEKLALDEIALMLENSEYEPESFPGLVFRLPEPRVAFLLFGTGKIICTGSRNEDDIHLALGNFKEKLEELGLSVKPIGP
ncbi:MAG: TATA-box-binding protein [Candidatus Aenigmatarchaeota archaeon]|nr:MAG: TATA-box-binding protein [Candidatus Aenigmarchaeota archaeon]